MAKKARLGLYLEDEEFKRQIKVAAAKRGMTTTDYCAQAIEERLVKDGERGKSGDKDSGRVAFLSRMDKLRQEIGPIGIPTAELVREGKEAKTIVKPQIGRWVGVLKSLKPKSSVELQHEVKDIWSKDYVSD